MTLTLDLAPETEAVITAEAEARGLPVEAVVVEVVTEWAAHRQQTARIAAWNRGLLLHATGPRLTTTAG